MYSFLPLPWFYLQTCNFRAAELKGFHKNRRKLNAFLFDGYLIGNLNR